jgi:hypothetical protein
MLAVAALVHMQVVLRVVLPRVEEVLVRLAVLLT